MVPVVTFMTYLGLSGQMLDLKVVVAATMYFDFLVAPMIRLTSAKSMFTSMVVSLQRISKFLSLPQVQERIIGRG